MAHINERGRSISLTLLFALAVIEIVIVWAAASQYSFLVFVKGDTASTHPFLILGVILISLAAMLTIGIASLRASDKWGNQRCEKVLGMDMRALNKTEVLVMSIILVGTLIGTAMWDIVTILNALSGNAWDLSVFGDDYLMIDFLVFKIVLPLWLHAIIGISKGGIGVVIAILTGQKVRDDTFCSV